MRATIIVSADVPGEREAAEAWFAKWRPHLSYCSENTGCGCCVDIWDVDAPYQAVAEIPEGLKAMSDWSNPRPANLKAGREQARTTTKEPRRKKKRR